MEINDKINETKVKSWVHLPEITMLCQYLNRLDLVELSKACKNYRRKLVLQVLEKSILIKYSNFLPNRALVRSLSKSSSIDILGLFEKDIKNKLQLVREITINIFTSNPFSQKFITLVPNITTLRFFSKHNYRGNSSSLLTILNELKYLKHIEFSVESNDNIIFNTNEQIFPRSLKSIKIHTFYENRNFLYIFDDIDSSYSNLTAITIASRKMLTNLCSEMPNLKAVEVLDNWDLDHLKLLDFIKKNPQLTKLKSSFEFPNNEVFKAVLSSKYLTCLNIYGFSKFGIGSDLPINNSIKNLKLDRNTNAQSIVYIINNCHNLEKVEFINWGFGYTESFIEWTKLDLKFKTFYFNECTFTPYYLERFDKLNFFKKAIFKFNGSDECMPEASKYRWKKYRKIPISIEWPIIFSINQNY